MLRLSMLLGLLHVVSGLFSATIRVQPMIINGCQSFSIFRVSVEKTADRPLRAVTLTNSSVEGTVFQQNTTSHFAPPETGTLAEKCDSFVTFLYESSVDNRTDCTAQAPDFRFSNVSLSGSFYCSDPSGPQSASLSSVLIMQVALVLPSSSLSMGMRIYTRGAESCFANVVVQAGGGGSFVCEADPEPVIVYPTLPPVVQEESKAWIAAVIVVLVVLALAVWLLIFLAHRREKKKAAAAAISGISRETYSDEARVSSLFTSASAPSVRQSTTVSRQPAPPVKPIEHSDQEDLRYTDFL